MAIRVIDKLKPQNDADFGLIDDFDVSGGYRGVADTTARDAITAAHRQPGMLVKTIADGLFWSLAGDLTTWIQLSLPSDASTAIADVGTLNGKIPADLAGATLVTVGRHSTTNDGGGGVFLWDTSVVPITITGATNASPIRLTTASPHGFNTGDVVFVAGVTGNTAANGTFGYTSVVDSTHVDLFTSFGSPSHGNGAYGGGGTVKRTGDGGIVLCPAAAGVAPGCWRRVTDVNFSNVRWWGAKGDGVTDDTAAIQAAIDQFKYAGGTVYFPAGTYMVSGQLTLKASIVGRPYRYDGVTLLGVGYDSCLKASQPIHVADGTGLILFQGLSAFSQKNVGIRNLRISGFDETTFTFGGGRVGPLVTFSNGDGSFVQNCWVDTSPHEGFLWDGPTKNKNALLTGNYATRVGGFMSAEGLPVSAYSLGVANVTLTDSVAFEVGCVVEQTGTGAFIGNCRFERIGQNNPDVSTTWDTAVSLGTTAPGNDITVQGNLIKTAGSAVVATQQGWGLVITDNNIQQCTNGISLPSSTGSQQAPSTIKGNLIYDALAATGSAIQHGSTASGQPVIIEGNTIVKGPTAAFSWGIRITDTTAGDIVKNNTIIGAPTQRAFIVVTSTNTAVQFIDNVYSDTSGGTHASYDWRGVNLTSTAISGIDNINLSATRPSVIRHSTPPAIGQWSVGDECLNTAPTANGIVRWICTTGGTPGTWTAISNETRYISSVTALQASTLTSIGSSMVMLRGYYTDGDGGGGHFYWDANVVPKTITGATNASPIRITATGHGWLNGQQVVLAGVGGNTAANGTWYVGVIDANTVDLYQDFPRNVPVAGNGAFTSGGTGKWNGDGGQVHAPAANTVAGVWRRLVDNDILNVRHFGAKGDGATDDAPAIQRALHAALATTGRTIYFPAGSGSGSSSGPSTYVIGSTLMADKLQTTKSFHLLGAGSLGSILKYTGGDRVLTVTGVTNANPAVVTFSTPHGCDTMHPLFFAGVTGTPRVNGQQTVTYVSPTQISVDAVDTSGDPAYAGGGSATGGALILFANLKRGSIRNLQLRGNVAATPATGKGLFGIFLTGLSSGEHNEYMQFANCDVLYFNSGLAGGIDVGFGPCAGEAECMMMIFSNCEVGTDIRNQNSTNWAFRSCTWAFCGTGGNFTFLDSVLVDQFTCHGNTVVDFHASSGNLGSFRFSNGRTECQTKFLTLSGTSYFLIDGCTIVNGTASPGPYNNELISLNLNGAFEMNNSNMQGNINSSGSPDIVIRGCSVRPAVMVSHPYNLADCLAFSEAQLADLDTIGIRAFDYGNSSVGTYVLENNNFMPADNPNTVGLLENQEGTLINGVVPFAKKQSWHRRLRRYILSSVSPRQILSQVSGLSGTTVPAKNLSGTVTVSGGGTTGTVTFTSRLLPLSASPEADTNYELVITPARSTGTPVAGSNRIVSYAKTVNGFTVTVEADPGGGNSQIFSWILTR